MKTNFSPLDFASFAKSRSCSNDTMPESRCFKESISIAKGAKVEVQIKQVQKELNLTKSTHEKEAVNIKPRRNEMIGAK